MKKSERKRLDTLEELARDLYGTDDVEVDQLKSSKEISEGADGIWVRSWLHVPNSTLKEAGLTNPEADGWEDA